jgi:hypothetical protein
MYTTLEKCKKAEQAYFASKKEDLEIETKEIKSAERKS